MRSSPSANFFGAPIIGQLSDHYGRRKLLILSLVGTVATLLLCALSVALSSLFFLFLGRFIGGLMAGNMTIAYAALADLSTKENKVGNFALLPLAGSVVGLHIFSFFIMLACAVGYTNSMALASNQAAQEKQGEMMGIAVSLQNCSEFLPASLVGLIAFLSVNIPMFTASLLAAGSYLVLRPLRKKASVYGEGGTAGVP